MREYERLDREYRAFNRELEPLRDLPAETTDGRRVNALRQHRPASATCVFAHRHGAEGVGLYRTEFPFLSYRDFPDEEEQLAALPQGVVRGMEGQPVTIRTLDLGADKYPGYLHLAREENPFLGWRSIRISLEMPELFKAQLRAILRVGDARPGAHPLPDDLAASRRSGARRSCSRRRRTSSRAQGQRLRSARCRSAS